METRTIWTIGHSTRSREELAAMLKSFDIEAVADIRHFPGSRRFPHFNKEELKLWLPAYGITYHHFVELGGRRKPLPDSHNTGWRVPAFRGYADYMETTVFREAIEKLQNMALQSKLAYMCSEAVWWRCHRALVSDYLKSHGWKVMHIMNTSKAEEHPYTKPAVIINGELNYNSGSLF